MKKLLKGFTLAEILITLSIIGVVAVIILPSIFTNVQKHSLSTQLAKFYSQTQEAIKRYMVINDIDTFSEMNADAFVKEYLNIVQVCNTDSATDCFASSYSSISSSVKSYSGLDFITDSGSAYILQDGSVITFNLSGNRLTFDVNGKKSPNKMGLDLHAINILPDGSLDSYTICYDENGNRISDPSVAKSIEDQELETCKEGSYSGCFAHLIRTNFKFDY